MEATESFVGRFIIRRGRFSAPKRSLRKTRWRNPSASPWLRGLSSISLEDRTCWCGRHGYGLRREVAHRKADVVNLRFNTDFRVFHPLLGRRRTLLAGNMAALSFAIERIVNFAEGIHGLEFQERRQGKARMDLVDHPGSLDVVGFMNPGARTERIGEFVFVAWPELKNGDANVARFGEVDLVEVIAQVVAAEGHDRARGGDEFLQFLLEGDEFRISVKSFGYVRSGPFDFRECVESIEVKHVRRTCGGVESEPIDRNLCVRIAPRNIPFRLGVGRFLAGNKIRAIEEKRVRSDSGFRRWSDRLGPRGRASHQDKKHVNETILGMHANSPG